MIIYSNLWISITPKDRRDSRYYCRPYRFLITTSGSSYTAFASWKGLKTWLRENNLKLGKRTSRGCGRSVIGSVRYVYSPNIPDDCNRYSYCLHNGRYVQCGFKYSKDVTTKYIYHTGKPLEQSLDEYRKLEAIYG